MKKKITITITLIFILSIIICIVSIKKEKDKSLKNISINDQNLTFIFETDKGNITGSSDDWLSEEYQDYELDVENSKCNGKTSPSELKWNNENHSVEINSEIAEKCTLYFFKVPEQEKFFKNLLNNSNEVASGNGYLYLHNSSLTNGANDNGYRFSGNEPDNYICFGMGSEQYNTGKSEECPIANRYRIIGLVPVELEDGTQTSLVKVIKSEYITEDELGIESNGVPNKNADYVDMKRVDSLPNDGFHWNSNGSTIWENGSLYNALNGYFLNETLGSEWNEKIAKVKWNVGGGYYHTGENGLFTTPSETYKTEMSGTGKSVQAAAKIGLMYVYDYGFASAKQNWNKKMSSCVNDMCYNSDANRQNNWLYNAVLEWTISRELAGSGLAIYTGWDNGAIGRNGVRSFIYGIRPVFYLNSDVKIKDEQIYNGSKLKPFKII